MTKAQAISYFHESNKPFYDYWAMQLAWSQFVDDLEMSDVITDKQRDNWGNPCTPKTFKQFNQKFTGNF